MFFQDQIHYVPLLNPKDLEGGLEVYFKRMTETAQFKRDGMFDVASFKSAVVSIIPHTFLPYGYEIKDGYINVFRSKEKTSWFSYPKTKDRPSYMPNQTSTFR